MAVPFFPKGSFLKYVKWYFHRFPYQITQITESLQVPGNVPRIKSLFSSTSGKRVLPFASYREKKNILDSGLPGSLTVEAALCLPCFLLFCIALMQPVQWLDRQRRVQTETEHFCETLSQYLYLAAEQGGEEERQNSLDEDTKDTFGLLSDTAARLWLQKRVERHVGEAVVTISEVPDEKGNISFEILYFEKIPFFRILPGGIRMKAAAKRRAWLGLDGKLSEKGAGSLEDGEEDGEVVYVGAGMGRYHRDRDCHYISNQYQTVSLNEAGRRKNAFGRQYTACSRCAGAASGGSEAFITPGGEHYHYSQNCSSMISYVRSVPLKEVEHLGACSYCSRRKGK
jgi:hypothetical protein